MNAINAISKGHLVDVTGKSGIIFGAARKIGIQIIYFVNAMQEKIKCSHIYWMDH